MFTIASGVFILAVGIATSMILARVLGPEGRGVFALACLLPSMIVTFGGLGIGPATAFYVARGDFPRKQVLGNNLLIALAMGSVGVLIGVVIIVFFRQRLFPGVNPAYLYFVLAFIPIEFLAAYTRYVLLGAQWIRKFNYVDIGQAVLFLALISVFLLGINAGVSGALACMLLTNIITNVLCLMWAKSAAGGVDLTFNTAYLKKSVTYGSKVHVSNILGFLNYRVDMLFISAFLGPSAVGLYAIGVGLVEKLWLVSQAAGTVLFPQVSAEKDEKRRKEFTPLVVRTVLWITALGAVALVILSRWAVLLLYSDKFLPAVGALQALLVGTVALSAGRVLGSDISGRGRPELNIFIGIVTVATNIVLNWIWIPRYGISGAAWASTVSYSISFLGGLFFYCRLSGNKWYVVVFPQRRDLEVYLRVSRSLLAPMRGRVGRAAWRRRGVGSEEGIDKSKVAGKGDGKRKGRVGSDE